MANTTIKYAGRAVAKIKGGISASATSIPLYPGQGEAFAKVLSSDQVLYLTITNSQRETEIVKVTEVSGDDLTVVRSQEGTSPPSEGWATGAIINQRLTAGMLENFTQKEAYRSYAADPNGVIEGEYPGEELLQTAGSVTNYVWWKNITGTVWQQITPAPEFTAEGIQIGSYNFFAAAWSESLERLVAVDSGGYICSSADGIDWDQEYYGSGHYFRDVVWAEEEGLFVAVGTYPVTSPDGVNWTLRNPGWGATPNMQNIAYSPTLGLFSGYCSMTSNYAGYSSDGINWSRQLNSFTSGTKMTWASGFGLNKFFMAAQGNIWESSDGINYSSAATPVGNWNDIEKIGSYIHIVRDVAVGGNSMMRSTNGSSYSVSYSGNGGWECLCGDDSNNVIVLNNADEYGSPGVSDIMVSSDNGANWTDYSSGIATGYWRDVVYCPALGYYVGVGIGSDNVMIFTLPV